MTYFFNRSIRRAATRSAFSMWNRVPLDDLELLVGQAGGLVEDSVGDGDLAEGVDHASRALSLDAGQGAVDAYRFDRRLLLCRAFCHLFVYDSKADEVHIKGYVRGIVQTDMKKKQVAVYVDSAQQGRHAELTAADMFHIAAVALVYCTHELMHQRRVLCPQFGHLHAATHRNGILCGLPLVHVDIEQRGLIGVNHNEGIKGSVGGDYRKVGLLAESLYGRFYPYDILYAVRFAGNDVGAAQIDVFDRRGEDQVYGFAERYLQPVGYDALSGGDLAALLPIGRSREQQSQQRGRQFYFFHIDSVLSFVQFMIL
mgnify:CR=1 FL=1